MPKYKQPQLPGLPGFIGRRRKGRGRVVKTEGKTYRERSIRNPMPLGLFQMASRATTGRVEKARKRVS